MRYTDRTITAEEYAAICEDFQKIERAHGIPESKTERLNVTVDAAGGVIGFASGLTNRKWFSLTDLWIDEKHRGHGLGAEILRLLEEKAKTMVWNIFIRKRPPLIPTKFFMRSRAIGNAFSLRIFTG